MCFYFVAVNSLARSSNIYDEGMSLSVACLRREDLIYEPQQKALQTSETEPPRLVSPVSADKQGTTKRKLLHRSETPSKKFKDDKVCAIIHPNCLSWMLDWFSFFVLLS